MPFVYLILKEFFIGSRYSVKLGRIVIASELQEFVNSLNDMEK